MNYLAQKPSCRVSTHQSYACATKLLAVPSSLVLRNSSPCKIQAVTWAPWRDQMYRLKFYVASMQRSGRTLASPQQHDDSTASHNRHFPRQDRLLELIHTRKSHLQVEGGLGQQLTPGYSDFELALSESLVASCSLESRRRLAMMVQP